MTAAWPPAPARLACRARVLLCALLAVSAAGCDGCDGCGPEAGPPLATLAELQGRGVRRDFSAKRGQWQAAQIGAAFRLGDGLRTDAQSLATLALADGSRLQVQRDTAIRFLIDDAKGGQHGIDVLAGEAVLSVTAQRDLRLWTHVGMAMLKAGTRVRLSRSDQALGLHVEVGEARFRSAAGRDTLLAVGDEVQLAVGMAILRERRAGAADADTPADPGTALGLQDVPDASVDDRAGRAGRPRHEGDAEPGPDYSNLGVRAGESFVVHAPEVPVAVAFEFGHKCKGEGVVELVAGKQRSRGEHSANLLLAAGARAYTLRCVDARGATGQVVARGTVRVLRDAGTRRLPPSAPTSLVDADGRSYTIYYQNQLPDVRLRWPNAPAADSYRLDVDGKVMTLSKPEHLFRSGSLRDGVHQLTFEAKGRKSRTARVEVRFDNDAPTASLSAPADRGFAAGSTVEIEGVTLRAWKVSVQGGTIVEEGGDRFRGQVVTSEGRPDIAVRLTHPRLGTHYYLRRAASSR
jgi:hypothetical protein